MILPSTNFDPGFRITRASHVVLAVRDLAASRQFYERVIGLILTAEEDDTLYFRGVEEACHHSLVLRKGSDICCARLGLRVFSEQDLDKLKGFFEARGCPAAWADVPHQSRTLHAIDPAGTLLEFCATMPVLPRMITKFSRHAGGSAQLARGESLVRGIEALGRAVRQGSNARPLDGLSYARRGGDFLHGR